MSEQLKPCPERGRNMSEAREKLIEVSDHLHEAQGYIDQLTAELAEVEAANAELADDNRTFRYGIKLMNETIGHMRANAKLLKAELAEVKAERDLEYESFQCTINQLRAELAQERARLDDCTMVMIGRSAIEKQGDTYVLWPDDNGDEIQEFMTLRAAIDAAKEGGE